MEELAEEYVLFARQLTATGSFSKAFDVYLMAFDKCAPLKAVCEPEFRSVMYAMNEILLSENKIEDIFSNFRRMLDAFPNNINCLNDIGMYLFNCGFLNEAWYHFQEALTLDSGCVHAEKNLNSIKNIIVERWHFRMLNDKIRNEAYRAAIHQTLISMKDCVLDLGTGTGLLAMYANECKPMAITACDGSEVMTELAEAITKENGHNEIIVVNKLSTSMNCSDIGGKQSLLITEMFDAGLFGEHVLQTLSHAWKYLISNVGRVIPNKAEFFVIGAKCDFLSHKFQLCTSIKSLLNISTLNVHILTHGETYDCEDVHRYGKDIQYMTEATSLVKVDFNNAYEIEDAINRIEPYEIELKAVQTGEINTYIGWFNLFLTDKITVTTDPRSEVRANAWQQAVFFDNLPKQVKENNIIGVKFLMNGGRLTMLPEIDYNVSRLSAYIVRFLNDIEYMKMISGCISMACVYLGQIAELSKVKVIDLCPFPMFGLQLLKRGIRRLICYATTENDRNFFQKVFEANDIPLSKITILVGDDWYRDIFRNEKYHAIFCNIFEVCGDIDLCLRDIAQNLKHRHLRPGGLFIPSNMKLMGQIVSSHWIDINNKIYNENTSGYKIAEYLDMFQVTQHFYVDLSHLEYTPLSEPVVLGTLETNSPPGTEVLSIPIIRGGHPSAILCWYIIEVMDNFNEISTNRKFSFIDGLAFMANPNIQLCNGDMINLSVCFGVDGSFKVMMTDVS